MTSRSVRGRAAAGIASLFAALAAIAPAHATVKTHTCTYNPLLKRTDLRFSLFRPYEKGAPTIESAQYSKLTYRGAGQQALVASAERAGQPVLVKIFTNVLLDPGSFLGSNPSGNAPYKAYGDLKKEIAVQEITEDPLLRLATIRHWFVDVVDSPWVDLLNAHKSSGWRGAIERPELTVADNKPCPLSLFLEMTEYKGGDLRKALGGDGKTNKFAALGNKRLPVSLKVLHDLLTGVYSLQAMGLAHLDIKPDNVFLTADDVATTDAVLGDYGQSRNFGVDGKSRDTLYYSFNAHAWSSPEVMSALTFRDESATKKYWHGDKGAQIDASDVYSAGIIFAQMLLVGAADPGAAPLANVDEPQVYTRPSQGKIAAASLSAIAATIGKLYGKDAARVFEGLTKPREHRWTVHEALREVGGLVGYQNYKARFLARIKAVVKAASRGAEQAGMQARELLVQELERVQGEIVNSPCMKAQTHDYKSFEACIGENLFHLTRLSWALVDGGQSGTYDDPWRAGIQPGTIADGFVEEKLRGPYVGLVYEAKAFHYDAALDALHVAAAHQRFIEVFGSAESEMGKDVKVAILDQWPAGNATVTDVSAFAHDKVLVVPGTNRGENHDDHGFHVERVLQRIAPGAKPVHMSFKVSSDDETKALLQYLGAHFDVVNASQTLSLEGAKARTVAPELIYAKHVFIAKSAGNKGMNLTTSVQTPNCTDFEGTATFAGYPEAQPVDHDKGSLWFLVNVNNDLKTMYRCSNVPGASEKIWKRTLAVPATVVNVGTDEQHIYETGTSYSAPYFAGLTTLLVEYALKDAAARRLTLTREKVREVVNDAIKSSAVAPQGVSHEQIGRGIPDAVKAMDAISLQLCKDAESSGACIAGTMDKHVNGGMFRLKVSDTAWTKMGELLKAKKKITGRVLGASYANFDIREVGGKGIAIGIVEMGPTFRYVKAVRALEKKVTAWEGKPLVLTPK